MSERTKDITPRLADDLLDVVRSHTNSDLEREVGGILAGRLVAGQAHVELALPALRAEGHRTNVTFTHEVWDDVLEILDRDHPDLQIVGWYHSHPGFGIFLSEYDQFIQQNFFPAEGMVALVVDPHTGSSGWFATQGGQTVRIHGDEPVAEPTDRPTVPTLVSANAAATSGTRGARTLLAAGAIVIGFGGGWLVAQPSVPTGEQAPPATDETIAALHAAEEREAELERALAAAMVQDDEPEGDPAPPDPDPMTYRVRRGDTLASLARAFSDDPTYLQRLIDANPQLDDPDLLTIGLWLNIPPPEA